MGGLLEKLSHDPHGKDTVIPHDIKTEASIAERVLSDVAQVNGLGSQVPYNCPNCGGVLWEIDSPDVKRYRCHTGHSFTAAALLSSQTEKVEETLCELSVRVRKRMAVRLFSGLLSRFDSDEKLVPFVMLA
jgi:two-component system chemotaxis response regulator CheB